MKTNKSLSKRLKITKKGKILAQKAGKCHFNAKESRSKQLNRKGLKGVKLSNKTISRFLPYNK